MTIDGQGLLPPVSRPFFRGIYLSIDGTISFLYNMVKQMLK
jgi:hypothetical protein